MLERFADDLTGETSTALDDLAANFAAVDAQGPVAYAEATLELHPDRDWDILTNDAISAVATFVGAVAHRMTRHG